MTYWYIVLVIMLGTDHREMPHPFATRESCERSAAQAVKNGFPEIDSAYCVPRGKS